MNKDKKESSALKTALRLYGDLLPVWWALLIACLVCAGSVALSIMAPDVVSKLTNALYAYDEGVAIDWDSFISNCVNLCVLYVSSAVLSAVLIFIITAITSRYYTRGFRVRMSDKIQRLSVGFVDKTPHGELLSSMMDDVSHMSNSIYIITNTMITGLFKIVAITAILYTINAVMATAVIILVPLSIFLSTKISAKSEQSWHNHRQANGRFYSLVEEDYGGFDTVKAFNLEERQRVEGEKIMQEYADVECKCWYLNGLIRPIIAFTNNVAYVAVCILGGYFAINNVVNVGQVVEVILLAKLFAGPLESIANGMGSVQRTLACAKRVYDMLDMEEMPLPTDDDNIVGEGNVDIEHVYFSYDKVHPLIKDLNVHVKAGQKVAIVGPTGGGKTTIVNLLMRFYDVDEGSIKIDGTDISTIDRAVVRNQFSMVLQDTWLFNGTVYDNIAYGKAGATRDEVMQAAKKARIDFFIDTLPNGYDTVINEESTNISSGQKQLLTIARSYLADRKMLILDEATSNVDTRTEIIIQKTMDELLKGRTSFVIAHRLSTIVNADLILVVNNGEIVEQGTHNELMQRGGFYTEIYNSQYELLK